MNKKLSLIILLLIGFLLAPSVVYAATDNYTTNDKEYYKFASEVCDKFYRNKDLGENNDLSKDISQELAELFNAKIEMDSFQRQTYDLVCNNYQIDILPFKQSNWSESNNEISMALQIKRIWYYDSTPTTISEVVDVTISKNSQDHFIMTGCYNRYESLIYGPIDELYQHAKLRRSNINSLLDNYVDDFKNQCLQKNDQMHIEVKDNIDEEIGLFSKTSLIRNDIKTWARNNYDKNEPTSSKKAISYYDFSQITGAYDCTNFVSHALLAGGATMHDNGQNGITGTDQWYFRNTSNRSSSWAGVNQLYEFLTRSNPGNSNIGPYATKKSLTYNNASIGDVVQGHNGTVWRHSTVVTRKANNIVYVTGRTSPGIYNDNVPATTIYGEQRLLHLDGNYN